MATSTIFQQRRFAVFGAQGYLGRHLAAHLQAQGHRVDAFDLQPAAGPAFDVADAAAWARVDTAVDAVFFFAGMTGTHQGFEQYERYLAANELGLLHLLDHLRRRGDRPRVVFPSSRLVYRGRPEPLPEDAPQESKTLYAANKRAGEAILQAYRAAFGIPTVVYRVCVPYGNLDGQSYSYGTIGAFIRMAKETG
ncbi:MAG: NAD-dependent epimerase/dehydratase family protein, partial [Kiritimatiellia bacterium]